MAQHVLNKYINGTVLCIKLSKSAILDINVTDIPLLIDNLLSGYFNSINLVDEPSNILDNNKIICTDTGMKEPSTGMKEPYDDMKDDYTNSAYYDYHTGYNS